MSILTHLKFDIEPIYRYWARVLMHIIYRLDIEGVDKIPDEGGGIIICNHIAYVDGLIINAAVKNRQIRYIIDKDIYNLPGVNYFMRHNRAIPIAPTKKDVTAALDEISAGLKNGDLICIFPEGQMTYSGHLGRFRPGIEWIVERDPVPIYPIALQGIWGSIFSRKYRKAKSRLRMKNIRRKIRIVCGEVIHPEQVKIDYLQSVIMKLKKS